MGIYLKPFITPFITFDMLLSLASILIFLKIILCHGPTPSVIEYYSELKKLEEGFVGDMDKYDEVYALKFNDEFTGSYLKFVSNICLFRNSVDYNHFSAITKRLGQELAARRKYHSSANSCGCDTGFSGGISFGAFHLFMSDVRGATPRYSEAEGDDIGKLSAYLNGVPEKKLFHLFYMDSDDVLLRIISIFNMKKVLSEDTTRLDHPISEWVSKLGEGVLGGFVHLLLNTTNKAD
jgi:hypothetical protein